MRSEYILSPEMPWSDGIKSMVQRVKNSQSEGGGDRPSSASHIRASSLHPQSNSLPWGHIKPGFSNGQKTSLAKQYWMDFSDWQQPLLIHPLSSLPLLIFTLCCNLTPLPESPLSKVIIYLQIVKFNNSLHFDLKCQPPLTSLWHLILLSSPFFKTRL